VLPPKKESESGGTGESEHKLQRGGAAQGHGQLPAEGKAWSRTSDFRMLIQQALNSQQ